MIRRCYLPADAAPWSMLMAYAVQKSRDGWQVFIVGDRP